MPRTPRILVDLVHARENNPEDYRHSKRDYEYYNSYSVFRLFRHLGQHGYAFTCHREGALGADLLADYELLFINLMHEHSPAFTASEIEAVHAWIEAGGGLLAIGEHTNAYLSADRINPLLTPLGLTMQKTTALEDDPAYATMPPGWVLVRHFDRSHPVCAEVDTVHFMAGGTVRVHGSALLDSQGRPARPQGIAFTSPRAWADVGGAHPPDFFGDGVRSEQDEQGSLPVCAVSEFGRGRALVIGDQNCWGDAWVGFRHNLRFALNAVEWLAPRPAEAASGPLRHTRPHGLVVGIDTRHRPYSVAKEHADDCFAFFNNWNRDEDVTALAIPVGEDGLDDLDVLVMPSPTLPVAQAQLERIRAFSGRGGAVVLLLDARRPDEPALALLRALAPSFALEPGGGPIAPGIPWLASASRLVSCEAGMAVEGIDLHGYPFARVRCSWGSPLVQARRAEAGGAGRLFDAASGCHARQSTTVAHPHHADQALDPSWLTFSHTDPHDDQPFWQVDLERAVDVRTVIVKNRRDVFSHRFRDLQVVLSEDADARRVVFCSPVLNPGLLDRDLPEVRVDTGGVCARFVTVFRHPLRGAASAAADRRVLSLVHVQVLARGADESGPGEPGSDLVDIARVGRMAGVDSPAPGPLVVFLQDGLFRNGFLNVVIDRRPYAEGRAAVQLHYALMDWLKSRFPRSRCARGE